MTNEQAIKLLQHCGAEAHCRHFISTNNCDGCNMMTALNMAIKALANDEWIPIEWHEITEEEREREGYPKDWVVHIDCDMPCDGDEILVQTKNGYIRWDVCYEDGEFSLDSGWDWIEDIVAWMPLPEPWKDGEEE